MENNNWQSIKDWIVAKEKKDKQPVPTDPGIPGLPGVPELPGVPGRKANAGYADGGLVGDEVDLTQLPGALDQPTQMPPIQPQMALPAPTPAPAMPQQPIAPFPTVNSVMGDPAQLKAERDAAIRPGIGGLFGMGIAGIGDAIARSYGHDANANHLGNVQNILANRTQNILKNQELTQNDSKERLLLSEKLEAKDPNSKLSKQAQDTYGALLKKSGFKPEVISKMPASLIADLTGKSVEAMKAESEAKMAAATLGLNTFKAKSEDEGRKDNAAAKAADDKLNAAKSLEGRGTLTKIGEAIFGDSPETTTLREAAGQGNSSLPTISSDAEYKALPHGSLYMANGIQHRKK